MGFSPEVSMDIAEKISLLQYVLPFFGTKNNLNLLRQLPRPRSLPPCSLSKRSGKKYWLIQWKIHFGQSTFLHLCLD